MVGVPLLTHIPIDIEFTASTKEKFFCLMHHVHIDTRKICKEIFSLNCARILILKISKNL